MSDPAVQLIANVVVTDGEGRVLLTMYDGAAAEADPAAEDRWWLPGHQLTAYQHPDDAARIALDEIGGITAEAPELTGVQSFRGRRGWHVSFDYRVRAAGEPLEGEPAAWHPVDDLPRTMHGNWERRTIEAALGSRRGQKIS